MADTKHPAEVLADTLDDESYSAESRRAVAIDEAADMLRTIPALEAERDQLKADVHNHRKWADSLAAELAGAKNLIEKWCVAAATVEAERNELRAEFEALRADAERYRWLRGYRFIWTKFLNGDKAVALEFGFFRTNSQKPERTDLDAAIDEARKQQ